MSKLIILSRLPRAARGAVIAVMLAVVCAAPAAAATPTRTVFQLHPFVISAGSGCSFDVEGQPSWGFTAKTVFPDGRVQYSTRAHGAYVNPATGASFPTADNFRELDRLDTATGIVVVVTNGQTTDSFLTGDMGPVGVVQTASLYHFDGTLWFTYNTETGQTTAFAYRGTITDVCGALS
jgi:hypothetical protein